MLRQSQSECVEICSSTLRIWSQGQGPSGSLRQLKKKLSAEGLFAEERKRALPFLPVSIGIVTSEKGAALRDMLRIIGDRYPDRRIVVWPVKVQGEGRPKKLPRGSPSSVGRVRWMS